ncbi:DUF6140 family protein [Bacteroides stercorirosoris]|jgi:hypothetical protein|uniref:Uncharacterized protein n=1 Tax=Bacteroides stercorirosoris TaxID=871324 RepID=A0A1M6CGG9_9BACE|nr:DUF6140 family protein [Bacteroides stercorirosoris]MBP9617866.1 hypothetical protein [Bacteroides sp.]OKZ12307.1 MAG: hypothetical protein BHV75_05700 [Bacteroides oleiciplenus]RGX81264.1 hypothetical protein DXA68_01200 [Bacteroides stercorirosoris]SHI60112.1 hypothetical protein SAMN05444350_104134 [Bacteroides stercorirosoris]
MARYRITVKMHARSANMVIEPGMSIEIASMYPPITHLPTAEQVNNIFKATFGVDLKKMGMLNSGYLRVDRIG